MKRKTVCLFGIVFLAAGLCMGGCGEEREENCLTMKEDGAISQRIVEDFAEDNYDLEELRAMTEDEIDAYCQGDEEGSVELTQLKEDDGKLTMVIDYQSLEAYNEFNGTDWFSGTIKEALKLEDKDYFSGETFLAAKDSSKVETDQVLKDDSLSVMVFEEAVLYEVDKKILYYSENVELVSDKCARLKDSEKGPGYLIY